MEKHFFFESDDANLFGVLHSPELGFPVKTAGLIFCSPFAEEKLWSQRVYVNFARMLSAKGHYALRFDYRGHGDSDGQFEGATIESRVADILAATNWFRRETGVKRVGFLGLRLGALLAALAAKKATSDFLVLWEPVIDGEAYIQQCLRSNLATQMTLYRKILYTREQLTEQIKTGENVNIDGYLISPAFYDQIIEIKLNKDVILPRIPIFACKINKKERASTGPDIQAFKEMCEKTHAKSCFRIMKEMPFWGELKVYFQTSKTLFDETTRWVESLEQNAVINDCGDDDA